jgi:hypothetical protein
MYGYAPLSWDLSDGRIVAVDVRKLRLPPTVRAAEVAFSVAYRDDPAHRLDCVSTPASVVEGWFRCAGTDGEGRRMWFRLGPGHACEMSVAKHIETYTTPGCWRGVAELAGGDVSLARGHFERNGMIVGYVSWVDTHGPVFAANLVGEQMIQLHDVAETPSPHDADLVLQTIALHWFEHAIDVGD